MSPERPKNPDEKTPRPEEAIGPSSPKVKKESPEGKEAKSPLFRMARLDGRDTLKYEDTADK